MRRISAMLLILGIAGANAAIAQTPPSKLVTQAIDETQFTKLPGNVHPLAQKKYDQGAVADSFAADRVLLLLNRTPEKELELQELLEQTHQRGSGEYHKWLTPQEFGERFGRSDSDIQAVANWLGQQGFRVGRVTKGSRRHTRRLGKSKR